MKEKQYKILTEREVPAALDARILGAARRKAESNRRHRRFFRRELFGLGAAAAALVTAAVFLYPGSSPDAPPAKTTLARSELLALADWSKVEEENYRLAIDLYSGRQSLADLTDYTKGVTE